MKYKKLEKHMTYYERENLLKNSNKYRLPTHEEALRIANIVQDKIITENNLLVLPKGSTSTISKMFKMPVYVIYNEAYLNIINYLKTYKDPFVQQAINFLFPNRY